MRRLLLPLLLLSLAVPAAFADITTVAMYQAVLSPTYESPALTGVDTTG